MRYSIEPARFRELLTLLSTLQRLHERLVGLGQAKLDAIRRADTDAMRKLNDGQRAVARRIGECEAARRRMMDVIGESMGLGFQAARAMPVSQLSARVSAPQRRLLVEAAAKLRDTVARVARVNRVISATSRGVLDHLGRVLTSVSPACDGRSGYKGDGRTAPGCSVRIFDAVG